ncbi:major facilitator superfamily domain-containing protein 12-like isoform X2 [Homalodisca vitripennis]|uniref:major facilitator superfamily domain-containing protein 12-like isoform X2 n=1 Tax=Homalodisca vitripennis TaxID=197043 RepID=UPI001EE9B29C|nr:major facilitator superfamily domain-containing protein 12-like isoform X2 [Homalodisca vitripennis]
MEDNVDSISDIISCTTKQIKQSKIPVTQVFYDKKIVSVRGFKFPAAHHTLKDVKRTDIEKSKIILKVNSDKETNGTAIVFTSSSEETWTNKEKRGIISKFSNKILKSAASIRKKIKTKCSGYKCGNQRKSSVQLKMMSCPPRYNSLTGKVMKRKEQYYRHIWMPVEESTAKDYLEKQFSWKGNMENGLKFNSRLTKESTPLVLVNDRKLPFSQKLAYGLGHFYNDICAAIWFTYALIFLQLVAEMGPVNAGFLLFIGQVVDAITTPVAGYLLDRTVNRKRWHLVGSLLVLVSFPLIFTTPGAVMGASIWVQMVYFSLSISVFQVGWAVVQIAHLSLLPELTTLTEERAQLTAHRYTASMAAHILVYFVAWALLSSSHAMNMKLVGPSDSWRFLDLAIVTSVIGLIVTMVFHSALKTTRGLFPRLPRKQEILSLQAKSLKFFRSPHLYSVAVIYTSSRLFMTLSLVYIPLFINETVLSQVGTLATVPLASFLVSAFAALIVKLCSVHCGGLRITYLIGSAFCLLGCVLVHFSYSKTDDTSKVFGVAILFGAGSSITMVVSLCVTANLIGLDTECGAFVYSTVTFADKLLNGLAVIIIEEMKCANTADCPYYYGGVLSYVNSGVVFCGLAVVFMLPTELFAATNTK